MKILILFSLVSVSEVTSVLLASILSMAKTVSSSYEFNVGVFNPSHSPDFIKLYGCLKIHGVVKPATSHRMQQCNSCLQPKNLLTV